MLSPVGPQCPACRQARCGSPWREMCLTVSWFQAHRQLSLKCSDRLLMGWAHHGRLETPAPPLSDQGALYGGRVTRESLNFLGRRRWGQDLKSGQVLDGHWGQEKDDQRGQGSRQVCPRREDLQACEWECDHMGVGNWSPTPTTSCAPS